MKRYIYIIMCMLFVTMGASAQNLRIDLKVQKKGVDNPELLTGCDVYYYTNPVQAQKALDLINEQGLQLKDVPNEAHFASYATTDTRGHCNISGYQKNGKGVLIIDVVGITGRAIYEDFRSNKVVNTDVGVYSYSRTVFIEGQMDEVAIDADNPPAKVTRIGSIPVGKDQLIPIEVEIDSAYARSDARFCVEPIIVQPDNNNDTIGILAPFIIDGENYTQTMSRRMGWDAAKNDKLHLYIGLDSLEYSFMEGRTDTLVQYLSNSWVRKVRIPQDGCALVTECEEFWVPENVKVYNIPKSKKISGKTDFHKYVQEEKFDVLTDIIPRSSRVFIVGKPDEVVTLYPSATVMKTRKGYQYLFYRKIYDFDRKNRYAMTLNIWYEDYNGVYHKDVQTQWLLDKDYNRYLDWSSVQADRDIDANHYPISAEAKSEDHNSEYKIEFVGTTAVLKSDSVAELELNRLYHDVDLLYNSRDRNKNYIEADTVIGYASPDGKYTSNYSLAQRRASVLAQRLRERYTDTSKLPRAEALGVVSTWTDAANLLALEQDSVCVRLSELMHEIIARNPKDMAKQGAEIGRLPHYKDIIEDRILPRLRRVEFKYTSISEVIWTPEQVYDQYKTDASYLSSTKSYYEYYYLLPKLYADKDWEGLEKLALEAYNEKAMYESPYKSICDEKDHYRIREYDPVVGDTIVRDSFAVIKNVVCERPYPLAAFYLAKCKIRNHQPDVKMLEKYLDISPLGRVMANDQAKYVDGLPTAKGWWNEEEMAVTQILMHCEAKDYTKAREVYRLWVNDKKRYSVLGSFLEALNGNYNVAKTRDAVASTSPMNYLVAWCAYADKTHNLSGYHKALDAIEGKTVLDSWNGDTLDVNDDRVQYMKAICLYNTQAPSVSRTYDAPLFKSDVVYSSAYTTKEDMKMFMWAAPMLKAIELNPDNLDFLMKDGNFNEAYRTVVVFFAKRLKDGLDLEDVKKEYDVLYDKYASK